MVGRADFVRECFDTLPGADPPEMGIELPTVAAVAHIPYVRSSHKSPNTPLPQPYRDRDPTVRHAICRLFATGNTPKALEKALRLPEPPADGEWVEQIRSNAVRAALRIYGASVSFGDHGPKRLRGIIEYKVGATPVGISAAWPRLSVRGPRINLPGSIKAGGNWVGTEPREIALNGAVAFEHGIRFRIGDTADRVGEFLTGRKAPWAFIVFQIVPIPGDRRGFEVYVRSSFLPTVVAWADQHENSMMTVELPELDGFLGAGNDEGVFPSSRTPTLLVRRSNA